MSDSQRETCRVMYGFSEFNEQLLLNLVSKDLGAPITANRLSACTTGRFNTSYFVEATGDLSRRYPHGLVLRIAPPDDRFRVLFYEYRMMRQEPMLHSLLRAKTDVPVAEVVSHHWLHPDLGRDYLLMQRLPGTPLSELRGLSRPVLNRVFAQVGECMRQVHNIHGSRYGYDRNPHHISQRSPTCDDEFQPMSPQSDWQSAFVIMCNHLLDDIERCGGYTSKESGLMRRLLERHLRLFERDVPPSLLHMDIWSQNLLVDHAGNLTGIVDWDRALWGDPEIEFAVLDYCGISEPAFWEGYGSPRDTSPEAEIRRVFYLLYEVQKYIVIRRVREGDPQSADAYRWQSLRLARTLL